MIRIVTRLKRRLRAVFQDDVVDQDLRDEARLHIELEAQDLMRTRGLGAAEAHRQAHLAFGGMAAVQEDHRDARGTRWIERRMQDTRYAIRGLRNRPGFALAVVLTLALGIGANTAMFSIVDRLLFRAPPLMHDASRSHRVYLATTFRGEVHQNSYIPYARMLDLRRDTRSFERVALFAEQQEAIGTGLESREVQVAAVSADFFGFFDAPPALGRYYTPAEDAPPAGAPVLVLSYTYWQTQYGRRTDVIGQRLRVGATEYAIIGVAAKGMVGMWPDTPPMVYLPAATAAAEGGAGLGIPGQTWWTTYNWTWAEVIAERKPGVSIEQANADVSQAFVKSYRNELSMSHGTRSVALAQPRGMVGSILRDRGPHESDVTRVASWIGGVALIVWLIACANVANLLLARALQRRREIAVRLALGVSWSRLAAQLVTESLILALIGGATGVVIAQVGGSVLRAAFLDPESTATVVGDPRALLFAGAAAMVAGLLTGLLPLVQTRHVSLSSDLRAGVREGTVQRSPLRATLLVFQGALSVILLVGAGLFVRSLQHVRSVPLGYHPERLLLVQRNMRGVPTDSATSVALITQLHDAAGAIPGVEHVSRQLTMPFQNSWTLNLSVAGVDSVSKLGQFGLNAVSPEHFVTFGTRVIAGRGLGPQDIAGAPGAMVVSQAMAKVLWHDSTPIGKCVRINDAKAPCTYVVGVAENIKADDLNNDPGLFYYVSAAQFHPDQGGLFVSVRGDPTLMAETVRKALQPLMPGISYLTVSPVRDIVAGQAQSWQLGASMFVVFGGLALILAAIGLYSVIAFNVGQRRHELGVRVALGATMGGIIRHVVVGGMRFALAGVVLGVALALVLGRWMAPLLFQESPRDPVVFVLVSVVLLVVAALASFIPARRAANVDPMRALRSD